MSEEKLAFDIIGPEYIKNELIPDNRTHVQRMFYDLDGSGNLITIPIVIPPDGDYKKIHDCIPLIPAYGQDDPGCHEAWKGKNVVVIGGRRRSRAGTGVEFKLSIDQIDDFVEALLAIKEKVSAYLENS